MDKSAVSKDQDGNAKAAGKPEKPEKQAKPERYSSDSEIPTWRRTRFFVILMLFSGMANAYVMRTNMSVAIVVMVNHTAISDPDLESGSEDPRNSEAESQSQDGEFVWSYKLQGYILSSFFYGYVITQIPFGLMIRYFGARHFLGWGMMVNSVAAFFVPISARSGGALGLCVVRFIQGLGEGPIVPCSHSLLAQWVPPDERSLAGAAVYAGAQFGTIVSMPLSGLLAHYGFDGGWPSIFYVFGMVSTVWCVLFIWLVQESPAASTRISEAERRHIMEAIWQAQPEESGRVPVMGIAKSPAFYAILVAHAGQNYGYETLMTMLPTYMYRVMDVDIKANGVISSLPYLAMWIVAIGFGMLADFLVRRNCSITVIRKLMNSLGQYGPAVALISVGFVHHSLWLTCVVFVLGMGLNGAIYSGFKINHLDLSPRFAGLLIAVTNCVANLVGLTAPMVAGHVIDHRPTIENWRIVFYIAAGVFIFTATFYNIFASGKPHW
ncbi:putative inorganic phosphate cotransporter [Drosophila rhopaloa]|uniref:Putative inorganic phosphate cotransporter n=1 Tax=Drosophila rhopaloa TaxID=1041015 RepID=A0A6P4EKA4_DRORH|nr:putative inorganic phosphate cotransporter [Drosophila rhopaloa]